MPTGDRTRRIISELETLAALGEQNGIPSIAREIRDERIPVIEQGRVSLVVLGEFNHGKSTVINALLGRELLPMGVTPTTAAITHIVSGTGPARLVRESGTTEVPPNELRRAVTELDEDDLRHVEVPVSSDRLDDGVLIVDTPGVNDISQQKVEITYGYVPRADVILYVLDASQPLKQSEIKFISERLLKGSLEHLFFVLGKVDILEEEELEEVESHVRTKLAELVDEPRLFTVSARRALRGSDPGFDTFRKTLFDELTRRREQIVAESGVRSALRFASMIGQGVAIERRAVELDREEVERRVAAVRTKLSRSRQLIEQNLTTIREETRAIEDASRENVRAFVESFAAALPRELDRASVADIKRYLPDFIHDTFREWLEAEGTYVALRLERLAEEVIAVTNRNMQQAMGEVEEQLGVQTKDLSFEVDTFNYDVGVFALGALGLTFLAFSNILVGGLLTISAPVLAFVLKDKVDDRVRERALSEGTNAIRAAGEKVEQEMQRMISEFAEKLAQFVEDAGDRLYRQVSEVLDHVLRERDVQRDEIAELQAELDEVRKKLDASTERLLEIKVELEEQTDADDAPSAETMS